MTGAARGFPSVSPVPVGFTAAKFDPPAPAWQLHRWGSDRRFRWLPSDHPVWRRAPTLPPRRYLALPRRLPHPPRVRPQLQSRHLPRRRYGNFANRPSASAVCSRAEIRPAPGSVATPNQLNRLGNKSIGWTSSLERGGGTELSPGSRMNQRNVGQLAVEIAHFAPHDAMLAEGESAAADERDQR